MADGVYYTEKLQCEMGKGGGCRMKKMSAGFLSGREKKLVCVTSGNSCLGAHIAKQLLSHAYLVRLTVQNPVEIEEMKEVLEEEELNMVESVVVAKMEDSSSLCEAFSGCHAVFHTSSFIDPHGLSGYSEQMAILEREGAKNVIEACSRTAYVKRCIFTSSLLASIWTPNSSSREVIDEICWSNEDFCRQNKLWFALGKTMAEKIVWRKSRELRVTLVTLCPALLVYPSSSHYSITDTSLPYLKGGQKMLKEGVLATADVGKVAEAHVQCYEGMDKYGVSGRYMCFDRVVRRVNEAIELENRLKIHGFLWRPTETVLVDDQEIVVQTRLCNSKLAKLFLQSSSCKQEDE